MHESSLGKQVLREVLARAAEANASTVRVVRGWIAETERLDPAAIEFHFAAHARGTPAEGARLELAVHWVRAACKACDDRYSPEHHLLICPRCGSTDATLLGRTGLGLDAIEVD